MSSGDLTYALAQLSAARNEIKNLRQQIASLKHRHKKDVEELKTTFECMNSTPSADDALPSSSIPQTADNGEISTSPNDELPFQIIGHIETCFSQKRGLPRQPGILSQSQGIIHFNNTVLNNPEHALEGLDQFSHMWILFYFHVNNNTHVRAKVAPPRLNGVRTGVFATRSPHRPSPIGLSLVKIDNIEDNRILFSGVDMLDGTPVLDVKPYIPQYDMPFTSHFNSYGQPASLHSLNNDTSLINTRQLQWERLPRESDGRSEDGDSILQDQSDIDIDFQDRLLVGEAAQPSAETSNDHIAADSSQTESPTARILDGRDSDDVFINDSQNLATSSNGNYFDRLQATSQREAPEGSEGSSPPSPTHNTEDSAVRVADWILNPTLSRLNVQFSDVSIGELQRISESSEREDHFRSAIIAILSEDPRSVYARNRHPNEQFTCTIEGILVTCRFDDTLRTCLVTKIEQAEV